MKNKTIIILLLCLALLGLVSSIYLTVLHYQKVDSVCDFNQKFSCTDVSRSAYARILNVPVSILGAVAYSFYAFLSLAILKRLDFRRVYNKLTPTFIAASYFYLTLISFFFSLYLTYVELTAIHVICPLCLLSQIIIILMVFLSYVFYDHVKEKVGNFVKNT